MKTRTGFVSNSSSSSFVVKTSGSNRVIELDKTLENYERLAWAYGNDGSLDVEFEELKNGDTYLVCYYETEGDFTDYARIAEICVLDDAIIVRPILGSWERAMKDFDEWKEDMKDED